MSLLTIIAQLGRPTEVITTPIEIPNKTITYSIDDTLIGSGSFDYLFAGAISKNPINGKVIDFWAVRSGHTTGNGKIQARTSTDNGVTWSAVSDIIDRTGESINYFNHGGGYSSNGRLHIFASDSNTGDMHYYYSIDDGATFSSAATITSPDISFSFLVALNDLIEIGDNLYFPCYMTTAVGDFTESAIYCMKSSNGGATWAFKQIKEKSSAYVNETTLFHLGGNNIGAISRVEATPGYFRLFISNDLGETWSLSGADSNIGSTISATHPPRIRSLYMESTVLTLALYYCNRANDRFYVAYSTAANLLSNGTIEGTFGGETLLLQQYSGADRSGYPAICHYNSNLEGIFSYALEISIDEANRLKGTLPTTHYNTLKTSLGI